MSPRTLAASGAAALLVLSLTACAPFEEAVERLAYGAITGTFSYEELDRDAPFAGSPAEDYGEGFPVPEAEPVGSFDAEQVAEAYDTTRALLEAVYLNEEAVFDENNSELTGLLSGRPLEWYLDNLGNEDPELSSRHVPFNLSPGTAEPVGDVVKVDGWMRAEAVTGEQPWEYLMVATEYTIVHPIARPGKPVSMRLVTSHFGGVGFYELSDGSLEAWPTWWRTVGPAHCLEDQYTFTPAFPDDFPEGEHPRGRPRDAYDLEASRDVDECGAVEGT